MFNNNGSGFSMPVAPIGYSNGNNGSWGDDWIALAIIAMIFGWGNGGWGNMGGGMGMFWPFMFGGFGNFGFGNGAATAAVQSSATQADIQRGFDNQSVMNKLNALENGLCSLGYDQLAQMNGINSNVSAGFAGVNNAICTLGYQNADLIHGVNTNMMINQNALQTQIADCCCGIQRAIDGVNFNNAQNTCNILNTMNTNTRDITDAVNAGTRTVIDYLCNQEIQKLRDENQFLRFDRSQEQQNNYLRDTLLPTARPAYITCSPYASAMGFPGGYGLPNAGGCC